VVTSQLAETGDSFCARRGHASGRSSGVAVGGRAWGWGVDWGYAWREDVVSTTSAMAVVVAVAPVGIEGVGGNEGI
jgi:hypothetical protein